MSTEGLIAARSIELSSSPDSATSKNRKMCYAAIPLVVIVVIAIALSVSSSKDSDSRSGYVFGHAMKSEFPLDPSVIMLNHGAYGCAPNAVLEEERKQYMEMEWNPTKWYRALVGPRIDTAIQNFSTYLGVNSTDLVLVENASGAINAVLRSLHFNVGDKILQYSWTYGAVKKAIQYICDISGAEVVEVELTLPVTKQMIIDRTEAAFEENPTIRLAVFDHISSLPSVIYPVKELITLARSKSCYSLIDGAHAVGQIPLSLHELDPDFYLSNGHKWLTSPKGSAFLYVKPELQTLIHPTVISGNYGLGMQPEFRYIGTRNYSPYIAVTASLEYRYKLGDDAVFNYTSGLCHQAATYLSTRWKTSLPVPEDMFAALLTVQIPCNVPVESGCYSYSIDELFGYIQSQNIWVVSSELNNGVRYFRVSCYLYNEMSDYIALADAYDRFLVSLL